MRLETYPRRRRNHINSTRLTGLGSARPAETVEVRYSDFLVSTASARLTA